MGKRVTVNVAAHAMPTGSGEPLDIPDRVGQIRAAVDWTAALPPRAGGFAWRAQLVVKRCMDILIASAALLLLLPVLAIIALVIRLTAPGPIFYQWRVLGRQARPFIGYKFRTMVVDADALKASFLGQNEMRGPVFKLRNDPRVTPFGRWLRKYSVDELPQLWSVLKGDMSLVGPRPPSAEEFVQFEPWQWSKLSVTPGITCLWQVGGRSEINDFTEWAALDLEYIRRWNLWLDIRILLRTIPAVLSARGAY